ncbi:MAG: T9SS type A sorting domain-containing protein, partial [Bacteroidota bacterium]
NVSDIVGCFDLSNPITVYRTDPADAAAIEITGTGETMISICVDGTPDPIDVSIVGTGIGDNNGWVITDNTTGEILGLPPGPPFDLDGAGPGVCDIWYIRYATGTTGIATGNNVSDIVGCFDLSNPITVYRTPPADAAAIEITGTGETMASICVDGTPDPIDVSIVGTGVGDNSGWVITDNTTGEILGLPPGPPFDLDGAGPGVCDIWYIRYATGTTGIATGNNVSDIVGCFDLSNPITVYRTDPADAAAIEITGTGETTATSCVDGVADGIDVTIVGTGVGDNSGWVITDNATGEILGLPPGPPFDLDGAGPGICDIWYIRYATGTTGIAVGNNVSDIEGCFDLSNPISVTREEPDGGSVQVDIDATGNPNNTTTISTNGESVVICVDGRADPLVVVHENTALNLDYAYVITDLSDTILAIANTNTIDLDGAGVGACRIYGWSSLDVDGSAFVGLPLADLAAESCSDISDNDILVVRQEADGGSIEIDIDATGNPNNTTSISADGLTAVICVDGRADPLVVSHNTPAEFLSYRYVITNEDASEILAITGSTEISLDGAGPGTCQIWGWSYRGVPDNGAAFIGGPLADLDAEDCSDISDNVITVIREEADGGSVTLENGDTEATICAGDGVPDPLVVVHTNTAPNLTFMYVITDSDADNTILAISPSSTIDLDGAGDGVCRIWGWSYRGLDQSTFIGQPLANLDAEDCSSISVDFVEVTRLTGSDCDVLSIGDVISEDDFSIYPNPANSNVTISYGGNTSASLEVALYDIAGRVVQQIAFNGQSDLNVDVSELAAGTYLININDVESGSAITKQLIKR